MSTAFKKERKRRRREEEQETKNVRNRIRRGKLPRLHMISVRNSNGYIRRRMEYVA